MPYLSKKYINELAKQKQLSPRKVVVKESFENIKNGNQFDIFLSYTYSDKDYALLIYALLIECGFSVYIDIKDGNLDRNDVDEETAKRLAKIMNNCRSLIYVHTPSAKTSKWCPWELGYMSGRTNFRCAVIPLIEDKEEFPHQEYLGLYPFVDYEKAEGSEKYTFWVNEYGSGKYVNLKEFSNGKDPYEHK